ncbi:MAG: glycosyltransferase family 39 protein [Methanophagales archaeon]|nr:glycosyltransferase family 39 protein [Methanophagales archaeon]
MKTENLSSWVVSRLAKLELFIEESRLLVVILIFLVGFFVRFSPLIIMGFPTELPFNGGGLYYHFSETILENNFTYPRTIPYYTDNGIPFAYPPLLFYLIAIVAKFTPLSTFILHIYLPTFISVATVIAFYFLAKEIFQERKLILFSTLVYAILPTAFSELIPGEGLCESFGVFIFIIGMIFMHKMFSTDSLKYILITGFLFGIAVLGSPGGGYAFAISLVVFSFLKGRGVFDAKKFTSVALIGAVVSSPWWLTVIDYHGIDILLNGFMSRHSDILGLIVKSLYFHVFGGLFWAAFCLFGIFYCIIKREFFLPIWFISVLIPGGAEIGYIIPIPAAILITLGLFKVVIPGFKKDISRTNKIHQLLIVAFILLIIFHGVGEAIGPSLYKDYDAMIYTEKNDMEAMKWIKLNTAENSIFFVINDQTAWWLKDWFPAITRRITLNTPYGSEWAGDFERIVQMDEDISKCTEAYHFTEIANKYGVRFTHIYISKTQSDAYLIHNLKHSESFEVVFENTDTIVFAKR